MEDYSPEVFGKKYLLYIRFFNLEHFEHFEQLNFKKTHNY